MGIFNNVGRYTYMDISEYMKNFNRQVQQGLGLKLDVQNNYDIQQKRLVNVGEGVDNDDAITKHQMEVGLSTKMNKNIDSNLDLQDKYNVVNSKQQSFTHFKVHYDNLLSFNDVNDIFLSREESYPIKANLDIGNNKIHNVTNDTKDDGVVNKGYIDKL